MKRILFVIDSLNSGGAEKSLVSLLPLFDYKKYEVDLLMFSSKGLYLPLVPSEVNILEMPDFMRKQEEGIKYLIRNKNFKELYIRLGASVSLRHNIINKKMHGAQINWKWITKGLNKIQKKYDIAIAYSQGTPTYFVAEKVDAHKKFCWVNIDYKLAAYNKDFDKKYYYKFNKIIAVSKSSKEIFIDEFPSLKSKVQTIYDIISPTLIKSMAKKNGGFGDNFDGLRILTIGRLVYQKGYEMAIEACHKLKEEGFRFKWYAIGEGNLKEELSSQINRYDLQDTFLFLGTYQNPYTFLRQSDIYVQPSRFEGFGLAIAEARILQKPIVATNFTVVHNQIRNGENGIIVDMNSESLYKGIKKLIENNDLRQHIILNLEKENVGTEEEIHKVYSLIES